jgi:hypothetical protein
MSERPPDLRDLARQIRLVAQTHPCWSQAHAAVTMLEEHLCAVAAVHELNRKLAEYENVPVRLRHIVSSETP